MIAQSMSDQQLADTSMDSGSNKIVVELRNVIKKFNTVPAVNDISFNIHEGEIVALLGPSGCGKSTALRSIAGLEQIDSGTITIDSQVMSSPSGGIMVPPEKRNVGLIFQNFALWPTMTVFDNVAYGLRARKMPKNEIEEKVISYLKLVRLEQYVARYPSQLSGGEQQRVALVRTLAYQPKVVLLDEPMSNLDLKERERVRADLRSLLKRLRTTALFVTHDQDEAFVISDRIIVMRRGTIIQEGNPRELYEKPVNKFAATFVGKANVLHGEIKSREGSGGLVTIDGIDAKFYSDTVTMDPGACLVVIRPNDVGVSSTPLSDSTNTCFGEVIHTEYRGSETEYTVRVGEVELVVSTHKNCGFSRYEGRGKCYIHVPENSVAVLPDSE